MNDKETIKNKFVNFEPEVDDLVINQKWEKIKYFVPQKEKKKRGAFIFLYGTLALLLISSLILVVLSFPKIILDGPEKEISAMQKNEAVTNTKNSDPKENINPVIEHPNKKDHKKNTSPNILRQKNLITNSASFVSKNSTSNPETEIFSKQSGSIIIDTVNTVEKDPLTYDQLPLMSFQMLIPEKNNEITSSFNPNYYLPKPVSPISIDLFGGIQSVNTVIKQNNVNQKNNNLNYFAGVGINYHFRNKFSLTGQFIYNQTNFNYKNTTTENKITKQIISISSSPASAPVDTTYYIQAFTNYTIRSNVSYNFALGTEYKFLQKKKLSLSAFALFNTCVTKYSYGYTRDYGKDVLVYVTGNPNPPPSSNLVSSSFKEGDYIKEENRITTGLMPGILLEYRLNNKTSLIFKPAYLIGFSETKLIINSSAFKLKENSFLLNVGLRFDL